MKADRGLSATQTAANFSDGYQQHVASTVNVIFAHMLGDAYTSDDKTRISNALIVGQVFGILLLGFVTDWWSRKAGMVFTSSLVVVGSLMATLALRVEHLGVENMLWYLTVVRGMAGVGVGGEFPAGAAVSSFMTGRWGLYRVLLTCVGRLLARGWKTINQSPVVPSSCARRHSSPAGVGRSAYSCT
jgi:MFS family permease